MRATHAELESERRALRSTLIDDTRAVPGGTDVPVGCWAVPVSGLALGPDAGSVRRHGEPNDPLGGSRLSPDVDAVLARRRGRGRPLPAPIARSMGEAMGADLDNVRIHTGDEPAELARSVQATAFTQGTDIYFGAGTYAPQTLSGQRLLAHELAHTVQQGTDRGLGAGPIIGRAADPAEAEADRVADGVLRVLRRQTARQPGLRVPTTPEPGDPVATKVAAFHPAPVDGTGTEPHRVREEVLRLLRRPPLERVDDAGPAALEVGGNGSRNAGRPSAGRPIRRFYAVVSNPKQGGDYSFVNNVPYQWISGTPDPDEWEKSPVKTNWWWYDLYRRKKKNRKKPQQSRPIGDSETPVRETSGTPIRETSETPIRETSDDTVISPTKQVEPPKKKQVVFQLLKDHHEPDESAYQEVRAEEQPQKTRVMSKYELVEHPPGDLEGIFIRSQKSRRIPKQDSGYERPASKRTIPSGVVEPRPLAVRSAPGDTSLSTDSFRDVPTRMLDRIGRLLIVSMKKSSKYSTPHLSLSLVDGKVLIAGNTATTKVQAESAVNTLKGLSGSGRATASDRKVQALLNGDYQHEHQREYRRALKVPEGDPDPEPLTELLAQLEVIRKAILAGDIIWKPKPVDTPVKSKGKVHGEMQLLNEVKAQMERSTRDTSLPLKDWPFGGVKRDCLACHRAFAIFNEKVAKPLGYRVVTGGTHSKLYPGWRAPDWLVGITGWEALMTMPGLGPGWSFAKGILQSPKDLTIPIESDEPYESDSDQEDL